MMTRLPLLAALLISGCTSVDGLFDEPGRARPTADVDTGLAPEAELADEEVAVLRAPPPPPAARTAEQFDTTTADQRAAAATPDAGGALLGRTVASLGDPGRGGFGIETPLVGAPGTGRLVYPVNGNSVEVELIPSGGTAGSGSRVSLAAFRILAAPLTDLPTLEVYAN